jgi:hypothetical protein
MLYSTRIILQMTDVIGEYVVIEKDLHEFAGQPDLCCGPTPAETGLQAQSQGFAQTLQNNYGTLFGQQQDTLRVLNGKLVQIGNGSTGPGFGAAEENANVSGIQNNAEAAAKNADQASQDYLAGQGGGAAGGIRSGVAGEIKAQSSTAAANEESAALDANTKANYAQGRENADAMAGGLQALAGAQSPNSAASEAVTENGQSFGQALQIQTQKQALAKDIAGGITSLGGAFLSGGLSTLRGSGGPSVDQVMQESQGNNADNYIQPPIAPTVAPAMAFPG